MATITGRIGPPLLRLSTIDPYGAFHDAGTYPQPPLTVARWPGSAGPPEFATSRLDPPIGEMPWTYTLAPPRRIITSGPNGKITLWRYEPHPTPQACATAGSLPR